MLALAAPIVAVQVGLQLMGFVDNLMVGRLGPAALGGVALGNLYFFNIAIFGMGFLMALDPVVAQAVGARDDAGIALGVQRGVVLAVAVTVVISLAMWPVPAALGMLDQPTDVVPIATAFVRWSIPGMLPFFLFIALRQSVQAMGTVRPVLEAIIVGNIVNLAANRVLIFGAFGLPALGVTGSALSTVLARWVMLGVLALRAWPVLAPRLRPWHAAARAWGPLARMSAVGVPIGLQWFFEAGAFALVTVFTGWLGTVTLAGHEITLSLASLTFMVPVGVSSAAAALVGRAVGAGDLETAREDVVAAFVIGVGFMLLSALVMIGLPGWLGSRFTTDAATLAVAASLIPIAGAFQVFDGTQAVAAGVLRGAGDTRVPMVLHLAGFWAVGIPVALWLAFPLGLGARGLWWGLTAGLATAGVLQVWRIRARFRAGVARLRI
ncbi:MAG: MATE family efflux transporter [Gemmatimonadaceae bacterium]|nr:MATE family efflux transporter [Gemmatimonadaceae bacterium]